MSKINALLDSLTEQCSVLEPYCCRKAQSCCLPSPIPFLEVVLLRCAELTDGTRQYGGGYSSLTPASYTPESDCRMEAMIRGWNPATIVPAYVIN